MAVETTLVLVKPDGVRRGLVGEVIGRVERKGLRLVGMKMITMSSELSDKHYEAHVQKPFYPDLKAFMTSGPVVALAVRGENAIAHWRNLMGATNPANAAPGSIRGDFCTAVTENVVHGSDSPESAERELGLWFAEGEILP
ncbi:MAG: nucleoside-diphosphate kinase [Candidatus Sumerlaeota bacterium]|nr:nucleoside-diphosphate kinase [Candidatus Sumerlaeota bacterium]